MPTKQEESSSFTKTIESVRAAEKAALKLRQKANEESERILLSGKKDAEKLRLEGERKALALKDKLISEGKKSTESQVKRLISAAQKESEKTRSAKADSKTTSFLMDSFLDSFE
jgi:vacuolar-type H+-ATPase subunit H